MNLETAVSIFLVGVGVVVLDGAWGNAGGILGFGGQCLPTDPDGLHLDASSQVVYEDPHCTAYVYEYGRSVFVLLSGIGIGAVTGGLHRLKHS